MELSTIRETNTPTNGKGENLMNMTSVRELNMQVKQEALFLQDLLAEINKVMVGQETLVERVLIGLLADGHILLEGVPGLAKTLLIKTTSVAIDA